MATNRPRQPSRALVLGGGGVTGIAWEVGVLAGLAEAGVSVGDADTVIGTSAGAFVGAAVAAQHDLEQLYATQLAPRERELAAVASAELYTEWATAFENGGSERRAVCAGFGRVARAHPEPVAPEVRRQVVASRLVTRTFPRSLRVTAIDADTGELHVFHADSGVPLADAVSASGAVPGIWPLEHIGGRAYTDGGMASAANAFLATGFDRVAVIAPMPTGYGQIPGAAEDVAALAERARAILIAPDEQTVAAIGPNPYDPERCRGAAIAGRSQGTSIAADVAAIW